VSNEVNARLKPCPTTLVKEIGRVLQKFRKKAMLSQTDIAVEIGFSKTSGFKYISWLETGRIKNPSLLTVLRYLKTCRVPWTTFFQELSAIDFKIEHENIMRKVEMPSSISQRLRKKIDRDTAKYENKIQYPKTPYQKLNWERIKVKIDKKVKVLLFNHQIDEGANKPYFAFFNELIANYDTDQASAIYEKYYKTRGLHRGAISEIKSIFYKIVRAEQKRLERQKALPSEKFRKMAGEFLKYRVKIEPIEAEVQKLLGELNAPIALNQAYKDFTRECYKALRKYYQDPALLKQKLAEIKRWWIENKLNPEVLEKVKEIVIRTYLPKK